jgi:hypothetical protein
MSDSCGSGVALTTVPFASSPYEYCVSIAPSSLRIMIDSFGLLSFKQGDYT